jgi:ABC-type proline/glycine betaine transport system permease subunit
MILQAVCIMIGCAIGVPLGVIAAHLFFNYCVAPILSWALE